MSLYIIYVFSMKLGNTALHYAIFENHQDMMLLLLKHRAQANIQNKVIALQHITLA